MDRKIIIGICMFIFLVSVPITTAQEETSIWEYGFLKGVWKLLGGTVREDYVYKIETGNRLQNPYTVYRICKPKSNIKDDFKVNFNQVRGQDYEVKYFLNITEEYEIKVNDYEDKFYNASRLEDGKYIISEGYQPVTIGSHTETRSRDKWEEVESTKEIRKMLKNADINGCYLIKVQGFRQGDLSRDFEVDNIISYDDKVFDEYDWWNISYLNQFNLSITNNAQEDLVEYPFNEYVDFTSLSQRPHNNSIRVLVDGVEITSDIWNMSGFEANGTITTGANIVFNMNITAGTEKNYSVYYATDDLKDPNYDDEITFSKVGNDIEVINRDLTIGLNNTYGMINLFDETRGTKISGELPADNEGFLGLISTVGTADYALGCRGGQCGANTAPKILYDGKGMIIANIDDTSDVNRTLYIYLRQFKILDEYEGFASGDAYFYMTLFEETVINETWVHPHNTTDKLIDTSSDYEDEWEGGFSLIENNTGFTVSIVQETTEDLTTGYIRKHDGVNFGEIYWGRTASVEEWTGGNDYNFRVKLDESIGSDQFKNTTTLYNLTYNFHTFKVGGYIQEDVAPSDPTVIANSTDTEQTNKSSEDLAINFLCSDLNGDVMDWTTLAIKDGVEQFSLRGSCNDNEYVSTIVDYENTSLGDLWSGAVVLESNSANNTGGYQYSNNISILSSIVDPTPTINSTSTNQLNLTNHTLACNFDCEDEISGNTLTYDLEFRNQTNGAIYSLVAQSCTNPSFNAVTLDPSYTTGHEYYSCGVNLTSSSTETSSTVFSNNITIENSIPENVTWNAPIYNNTILVDSNVTYNCSADDTDGDNLYYEIHRDAATNPPTSLISNETSPVGNNTIDGSYWIRCRAGDAYSGHSADTTYRITVNNVTIANYTNSYKSNVTGGESLTLRINISHNNHKVNWTNATLRYLNVLRETIQRNISETLTEYTSTFTVDSVSSTTEEAFNYSVDLGYINGSVGTEISPNYIQTVNKVSLFSCDGVQNSSQAPAINFTFYREVNNTQIIAENLSGNIIGGTDLDATMELWNVTPSVNTTMTLSVDNQTEMIICIEPPGNAFTSDALFDYGQAGFDNRQYYFDKSIIDNRTQNISLFLLETIYGREREIEVEDGSGDPVAEAILFVDKFFMGTNTFQTVAMGKTDSDGTYNIFLKDVDTFYRFRVVKGGKVLYSDIQSRQLGSDETDITLVTDESTQADDISAIEGVTFSVSNTSTDLILDYVDTSGSGSSTCFSVIRRNSTFDDYVCNTCQSTASGSIICDANQSGTYIWAIYSTLANNNRLLIESGIFENQISEELFQLIGSTGLVASFFIILVFGLLGITMRKVSTTVVFTLMGVVFSVLIDFINIGWNIVMGIIIGGVLIIIMSKE